MDPILSAKSTNLADAFSMLLAIQQGPNGPAGGRIFKRTMIHNNNPFIQFIFSENSADPQKTALTPARYVSVEFRQWDGFFYVYTHTAEEIKYYLPKKILHEHQGFNYAKFTSESEAQIYSIYQIERATREALGYLIGDHTALPKRSVEQTRETLQRIMDFKNYHKTGGRVYVNISDLGTLLEK